MSIMNLLKMFFINIGHLLLINQAQLIFLFGGYLAVRLFIFLRLNYKGKRLFEDLVPLTIVFSICAYNFLKHYYQNMGQLGVLLNNLTLIIPVLFYVVILLLFVIRWRKLPTGNRMPVNSQQMHKRKWVSFMIEVGIVATVLMVMYINY